jgi:hypothetical protein
VGSGDAGRVTADSTLTRFQIPAPEQGNGEVRGGGGRWHSRSPSLSERLPGRAISSCHFGKRPGPGGEGIPGDSRSDDSDPGRRAGDFLVWPRYEQPWAQYS